MALKIGELATATLRLGAKQVKKVIFNDNILWKNRYPYFFIGGGKTTQLSHIYKYDIVTRLPLAKADFVIGDGTASNIYSMTYDDEYLYASGENRALNKYDIDTMALVANVPNFGNSQIHTLVSSGPFLYTTGSNPDYYPSVMKLNKSDLSYVADCGEIPLGGLYSMTKVGDFLYGVSGDGFLVKINANTMTIVSSTDEGLGAGQYIQLDGDYLYILASNYQVKKYDLATLSLISSNMGLALGWSTCVGDYIYQHGRNMNSEYVVRKYDKNTMLPVGADSVVTPEFGVAMALEGGKLFAGTNGQDVYVLDPITLETIEIMNLGTYGLYGNDYMNPFQQIQLVPEN